MPESLRMFNVIHLRTPGVTVLVPYTFEVDSDPQKAAVRWYSSKKVFLKFSQYSQEDTGIDPDTAHNMKFSIEGSYSKCD